jgi:hypothetical protein
MPPGFTWRPQKRYGNDSRDNGPLGWNSIFRAATESPDAATVDSSSLACPRYPDTFRCSHAPQPRLLRLSAQVSDGSFKTPSPASHPQSVGYPNMGGPEENYSFRSHRSLSDTWLSIVVVIVRRVCWRIRPPHRPKPNTDTGGELSGIARNPLNLCG